MAKTISAKKRWVSTDAWRGYEEPVNAVAGANDTGTWGDSPCPSDVCTKELEGFKAILRKQKIRFHEITTQSSNVFCVHRYILTHPEDRERAKELAREYEKRDGIDLFYEA